MSKLKTPQQKKKASLSRDRREPKARNGKNGSDGADKARSKVQRAFRHGVHQTLHVQAGPVDEELAVKLDAAVKSIRRKQVAATPGVPLAEYLGDKKVPRAVRKARG